MARIGFIGLGNMGLPMARNLLAAGHAVTGHDLSDAATDRFRAAGGAVADSAAAAVTEAEFVITMLPEGRHVREVYSQFVFGNAARGAQLIDCSTIDVQTAREVAELAGRADFDMLDAPVSGGTVGAEAATLTFMVGGSAAAFERAGPVLEAMGRTIVHCGGRGNGQAAKICNNMIMGISLIATCEGFALGEKLGLDAQTLFDVTSRSSGQCWAITTYCPAPGPVPTAPSNRDYRPGFTAAMMSKDLHLARAAAMGCDADARFGAAAAERFAAFIEAGNGEFDCSAIFRAIRGE